MRVSWPAAALTALFSLPACAQWQGSIAVGARSATHAEYDAAGGQLVREHGWLPGAGLHAAYAQGRLRWFGGADWYGGDIDYGGRTQAGIAAASTTSTGLAAARLGAAYSLGNYYALSAVEADRWRRDIRGTAAGAGLQETYRSSRLLLGAGASWRPAAGDVSAEAAFILAAPEHMRIGFSGLYDPVSLDTRRGRGLRLEAAFRPAWASYLQVQARADWLTVPRSGAAALTANGAFRGTVTQPEHVRKAFTLALAYLF